MFVDESFTSFLLSGIEKIEFGDLRNAGVLEFYGVVEGSMKGKNIVGLFRENFCKVNAEFGDRDLLGFVSLAELCQDIDLVDLFT